MSHHWLYHIIRVGPNRMTVYTPYPRYAVYPVPYMTLSHRVRNRMTVYGFQQAVYESLWRILHTMHWPCFKITAAHGRLPAIAAFSEQRVCDHSYTQNTHHASKARRHMAVSRPLQLSLYRECATISTHKTLTMLQKHGGTWQAPGHCSFLWTESVQPFLHTKHSPCFKSTAAHGRLPAIAAACIGVTPPASALMWRAADFPLSNEAAKWKNWSELVTTNHGISLCKNFRHGPSVGSARTIYVYVRCIRYTGVYGAKHIPNMCSYTVYIHGSGQP